MANKFPSHSTKNWLNSENTAKLVTPEMENSTFEFNDFLFCLASWFLNIQRASDQPKHMNPLAKTAIWAYGREPKVLNEDRGAADRKKN